MQFQEKIIQPLGIDFIEKSIPFVRI